MTETTNLHLPQWEAEDRILHDDFNAAMEKIDAAMPRIVTGTYTGTGTGYVHLNFTFTPKIILIFKTSYPRCFTVNLLHETDSDYISVCMVAANNSSNTIYGANCRYRLQNNEFSIVNAAENRYGLNEADTTYLYAAIG